MKKPAADIDRIACECVAVKLRMLNRVVTKIYDEALRPLDLKVSQMNVLVATAKFGTVRPTELGEALHLEASTLSRNLERMEARGWLEVVVAEDGRSQPVRLTAQGRQLLERAVPAWETAQAEVTKRLGRTTIDHLRAAAKRADETSAD